MIGWIRRLFRPAPDAGRPVLSEAARAILSDQSWMAEPYTTRRLQESAIAHEFSADIRASILGIRSMDQWLERVAEIEAQYSMRVRHCDWAPTYQDALDEVDKYRIGLTDVVKRHANRKSRIFRYSRSRSLA